MLGETKTRSEWLGVPVPTCDRKLSETAHGNDDPSRMPSTEGRALQERLLKSPFVLLALRMPFFLSCVFFEAPLTAEFVFAVSEFVLSLFLCATWTASCCCCFFHALYHKPATVSEQAATWLSRYHVFLLGVQFWAGFRATRCPCWGQKIETHHSPRNSRRALRGRRRHGGVQLRGIRVFL